MTLLTAMILGGGLLAGVAGVAGVMLHHQRFHAYHQFKGRPLVLSVRQWLRSEGVGALKLLWWGVTGLFQDGLRVPNNVSGRPVLCVHGYTQNATNFVGLRRALERRGVPTLAVSLWYRFAPMRWYARRLERKLEALVVRFPDGIDVVAHSMGGIVLRMVLHARADLRQAVRTVITLGSPHEGTAAARGIPLVPEIRALKRRSTVIRALPSLTALLPHARVVGVAGDLDTVVYPLETAFMPGAGAVVLRRVGHAGLLTEPRAWVTVRLLLRVRTC